MISSQIFLEQPPNRYSVVKNSKEATVGQVISDGVQIDFANTLTQNFTICISLSADITERPEEYTTYDLAMILGEDIVPTGTVLLFSKSYL